MIFLLLYTLFHLSSCVVHCQHLEWNGTEISNNTVIYYANILNGPTALKCLTDNNNCCSNNTGNWINQTGQMANQEPHQDRCLYFTRGDHVISLSCLWGCIPPLAGLWRCDVPDSSGVVQSLFIYIACNIKNTFHSLLRTNTTTITGINDHVCLLSTSLLRYSGRGTERTYRCHLFLQQYTCQCDCVLGITS